MFGDYPEILGPSLDRDLPAGRLADYQQHKFRNQKQIKWDTTITADNASARDADGLQAGFIKGANFGKPTNDNQFAQPIPGTNGGRLFRMALGIRF